MNQVIINMDSQDYISGYEETKNTLKNMFRKGENPDELELDREPGESDNHYYGCLDAFKDATIKVKKKNIEKTLNKMGLTTREIELYYGTKIEK
jgi:hypothetical protein